MTDDCKWTPGDAFGKRIEVRGRGLMTTEDSVDDGKRVRAWDHRTGTFIWVTRDRGGEWVVLEVSP